MTLEERVTQLEEDAERRIVGEIWFQGKIREWADNLTELTSEKTSGCIKVTIANNNLLKKLLQDLQEHFKSHSSKKKDKYTSYTNE